MELSLTVISVVAIIATALYYYAKRASTYWERRGVEVYKSTGGHFRDTLRGSYEYFRSKNLEFGGFYVYNHPIYVPVELDQVKNVLQRDFKHFVNHRLYHDEKGDPLSAHLVNLEDEKWKNLREKLTPTFTTGKIKMMFKTMADCTASLTEIVQKESSMQNPIHIKDLLSRFTTDVIGSAAFGIDCNSLKDPDCEFRIMGKAVFGQSRRSKMKQLLPNLIPWPLLRAFGFRVIDRPVEDFFMNLVRNIINYRETNNVYRKDFMHMMLQLKNRGKTYDDEKIMDGDGKGEYMKFEEVAAQCFVFFVAGFETSSSLMTFVLLELSQHQDIQDKLREEMIMVLQKHGGLTYDAIVEMQYLDQVVDETLRIHSPAFATDRICTADYRIPGTDVTIKKGTRALIPIYAIHHDPRYYSDPEKFDPDRFSPENKRGRPAFAFLPFGEGPRMCIGARFGRLQAKVGLTAVISNFKVTLNSKTQLPIEYDSNPGLLSVKGNVWLNATPLQVM